MTADTNKNFARVFQQLQRLGLLLVSGSEIPDVRSLITNKQSKGSWWADPHAQLIFDVIQLLEDHPDVTVTKLVSRKVTFVHRRLWNHLFVIAKAREDWQLKNLSTDAATLLQYVDEKGSVRTDEVEKAGKKKTGDVTRELEQRLLVHSDQIHTETGAHAKVIETWMHWAKRVKLNPRNLTVATERHLLERRLEEINETFSGHGKLPWQ